MYVAGIHAAPIETNKRDTTIAKCENKGELKNSDNSANVGILVARMGCDVTYEDMNFANLADLVNKMPKDAKESKN